MGSRGMAKPRSNQELVLSADANPRLKWTRQLHELFVEAVSQLGGADKATPKTVMRVMGIPGLTLYHLKSHLQKYRLARSNRDSNMLQEQGVVSVDHPNKSLCAQDSLSQPQQYNDSMLKMQMEVQRKLQEQIEVQRHLQLRIEAQGKYLQSVLKLAQETLAGYSLNNTIQLDAAKAELSELVSTVETESTTSASLSQEQGSKNGECSTESCVTSNDALETIDAESCKQDLSGGDQMQEDLKEASMLPQVFDLNR